MTELSPWIAIGVLACGTAIAAALVAAGLARFSRMPTDNATAQREKLIDRIEDCLPRTQCAQCGYPGCRPYAEALLDRTIGIDKCPPGGTQTVKRLAELLGEAPNASVPPTPQVRIARIIEADCIGCALCLPACPTDAIVGAHRFMHTVIAADCTGCELCLAPCPVDCIELISPEPDPARIAWSHTT